MIIVICILILIIAVGTYGIINLLKQTEQLEKQCLMYIDIISEVRDRVLNVEIELKEIDIKGSFEADDEVGFVFKEIKLISEELVEIVNKAYEYTESE